MVRRVVILLGVFVSFLWSSVDIFDVCLDPGHSGINDPGAVRITPQGDTIVEARLTLATALNSEDFLSSYWKVILTRRSNDAPDYSPVKKAMVATGELGNPNSDRTLGKVRAAISIHYNSTSDGITSATGVETYYVGDSSLAHLVNQRVFEQLSSFLIGYRNRGLRSGDNLRFLSYLAENNVPACLVEVEFINNPRRHDALRSGQIPGYAGMAIGEAIEEYLGSPDYRRYSYFIFRSLFQRFPGLTWRVFRRPRKEKTTHYVYRKERNEENYTVIASVTDTFFVDSTVEPGKKYTYFVSFTGSGYPLNTSTPVTIHTSPFKSNWEKATGPNNARKVFFDEEGNLHLVYGDDDDAFCGDTLISERVGMGLLSSIQVDKRGRLFVVSAGFGGTAEPPFEHLKYYNLSCHVHTDTGWKLVSDFELENDSILSISFVIDTCDTGWILFNVLKGSVNELRVGKFYINRWNSPFEVEVIDSYEGSGVGSIALREWDNSLHVVYEKNGKIYYTSRENGVWTTPHEVSYGHNPSISVGGTLVHIVWEEYLPTVHKIRHCFTDGNGWSRIRDVMSLLPSFGYGFYPYIFNGSIVTWHQLTSDLKPSIPNYDIYASTLTPFGTWSLPRNISNTPQDSRYPQVAIHQTPSQTTYGYIWTEGDNPLFEIKILSEDGNRIPLYAFDLGDEEPSLFTLSREGQRGYGDEPEKRVDYAKDSLGYKVPGLNPKRDYLVSLVFYQEEEEKLLEEIMVDGVSIKTVTIPKGKVVIEEFSLPQELYSDGVIELLVKNRGGGKCILSAFAVYEFLKEGTILSALKEKIEKGETSFSIKNIPGGKVEVSYYIPERGEVTLEVYSVTGSLVKRVKSVENRGVNTFHWDGSNERGERLPKGVYFIRIEFNNKLIGKGKLILF